MVCYIFLNEGNLLGLNSKNGLSQLQCSFSSSIFIFNHSQLISLQDLINHILLGNFQHFGPASHQVVQTVLLLPKINRHLHWALVLFRTILPVNAIDAGRESQRQKTKRKENERKRKPLRAYHQVPSLALPLQNQKRTSIALVLHYLWIGLLYLKQKSSNRRHCMNISAPQKHQEEAEQTSQVHKGPIWRLLKTYLFL